MSQHIFNCEVGPVRYEVMTGWDRPLQRFYFVISPYTYEHGDKVCDDPVASNLYLARPGEVTLEDIVNVCTDHGISIPSGLIEAVFQDAQDNAGNKVVVY